MRGDRELFKEKTVAQINYHIIAMYGGQHFNLRSINILIITKGNLLDRN